jgi:hypothetical protein
MGSRLTKMGIISIIIIQIPEQQNSPVRGQNVFFITELGPKEPGGIIGLSAANTLIVKHVLYVFPV